MPNVDDLLQMRRAAANWNPQQNFRGMPEPLTDGSNGYRANRYNAPIYSASGLDHVLDRPYLTSGGAINPSLRPQPYAPQNGGGMDPLLGMTLHAGNSGAMSRGALAFLGQAYNPWTKEAHGAEGEAPADQNNSINELFDLAQRLGIDTSKYTRDPGQIGMRGERSADNDAMALFDAVNHATRDYVSVGGLASGWAGGGLGNMARTIYKEVDGRLLPVTQPEFSQRHTNNGFFSRDAIAGASLMLPAFGGWAGMLGAGAPETLSAGAGLGLTSSVPNALVNFGVNTLLSGGRVNPLSLASAGLSTIAGGGGVGGAGINPMSYFQSALGATGLGRSPVGQGTSLVRLLGALASRS